MAPCGVPLAPEPANRARLLEVEGFRPWCLRCRRPGATCLCDHIGTVACRTRFVFLTHPKEERKIKNGSGRLAHLSLPGSEIVVGVDFSEHPRVQELLGDPRFACQLLYPSLGEAPAAPPSDAIPVLFVLDATWPSAKRMMRESTNLHRLPRLDLPPGGPSQFLIKQQPAEGCLATIEAVDRALHTLAGRGVEDYGEGESSTLLRPFHRMVQMGLDYAAAPPPGGFRNTGPYRPTGARIRRRRTHRTGRNVVFGG